MSVIFFHFIRQYFITVFLELVERVELEHVFHQCTTRGP